VKENFIIKTAALNPLNYKKKKKRGGGGGASVRLRGKV
jgi:hypothetical protein